LRANFCLPSPGGGRSAPQRRSFCYGSLRVVQDGDDDCSQDDRDAQDERHHQGIAPSAPSVQRTTVSDEQREDATIPNATHNIDEYNWSGFSCPYCSAPSFVACAGSHLACDGTAELRNGRRFHQCFCGQAGFISSTPMKTLESKRISVKAEVSSPTQPVAERKGQSGSADIALPPPTRGQPPAKR
jgi:hypothetical protein